MKNTRSSILWPQVRCWNLRLRNFLHSAWAGFIRFLCIPCDTGIFLHILGIERADILLAENFNAINRGTVAEIFAGLELLKSSDSHARRQLYCWHREKPQSSAQVDYLVQKGSSIIPIEVKAGTQGGMKSLELFMKEKNINRGVRCSLENFAQRENFDIYPLYAISNLYTAV